MRLYYAFGVERKGFRLLPHFSTAPPLNVIAGRDIRRNVWHGLSCWLGGASPLVHLASATLRGTVLLQLGPGATPTTARFRPTSGHLTRRVVGAARFLALVGVYIH